MSTTNHPEVKQLLDILEKAQASQEKLTDIAVEVGKLLVSPSYIASELSIELEPGSLQRGIYFSTTPQNETQTWMEDLLDILPTFEAPTHRYKITTANGMEFYTDAPKDSDLPLEQFEIAGQAPKVEDLGLAY